MQFRELQLPTGDASPEYCQLSLSWRHSTWLDLTLSLWSEPEKNGCHRLADFQLGEDNVVTLKFSQIWIWSAEIWNICSNQIRDLLLVPSHHQDVSLQSIHHTSQPLFILQSTLSLPGLEWESSEISHLVLEAVRGVCVGAQCRGVVLYVTHVSQWQTWQLFMTGTWHGNTNQLALHGRLFPVSIPFQVTE